MYELDYYTSLNRRFNFVGFIADSIKFKQRIWNDYNFLSSDKN